MMIIYCILYTLIFLIGEISSLETCQYSVSCVDSQTNCAVKKKSDSSNVFYLSLRECNPLLHHIFCDVYQTLVSPDTLISSCQYYPYTMASYTGGIVLFSFFSAFIIFSFYLSTSTFTIHYECFGEEFEREALKDADTALKLWKRLDMAMIILCIISGLLSFTRDFLTNDDIIQADYLQEKEDGKDPNSSGFFYEDRNSSAASRAAKS